MESTELLSCQVDSEGTVSNFVINGSLNFKIMNPVVQSIIIKTTGNSNQVNMRLPPQFDKKLWTSEGTIISRDEKEVFKPKTEISVLKYKYTDSAKQTPFMCNFWANPGKISVELDWNVEQTWIKS